MTGWPKHIRRKPMEALAIALIGAGFLMLFQPFLLELYSYSFITMLVGTLMFIVVWKLPD